MANRTVSKNRRSGKVLKRSSSKKKNASAPRGRISLRDELEKAAAGLSYTSESDYPFRFFALPADSDADLTPQGFLYRISLLTKLTYLLTGWWRKGHSMTSSRLTTTSPDITALT